MLQTIFGKKRVRDISQNEAKSRLNRGGNIFLLDVRTPEEYEELHIPNSISLPLDQLKSGIKKVTVDKDAEIIVYCLSGMRAAAACRQLAGMGYTNVSNMGGIQTWKYETERGIQS